MGGCGSGDKVKVIKKKILLQYQAWKTKLTLSSFNDSNDTLLKTS